jgi:hypothetical protein
MKKLLALLVVAGLLPLGCGPTSNTKGTTTDRPGTNAPGTPGTDRPTTGEGNPGAVTPPPAGTGK